MKTTLKDIDTLDIDFVCTAIENSLKIKYNDEELSKIKNLGDLCDLTVSKIDAQNLETCTSQEAFYKIRNAFSEILNIEKSKIEPKTEISKILPRKNRIKNIKSIESKLGFKIKILTAPNWIIIILFLTFIFGIILLFITNSYGILLIIFSLLGFQFCKDYGKELKMETFEELTENAVLNNYSKSRRVNNTVNKNEIEKIIIGLFTNLLDFPKNELTRETTF